MKFRNSLMATTLCVMAGTANATLIDFAAIADGPTGESVWDPYVYVDPDFNLSITATKNGAAAFAYLDRGTGGLGVCQTLNASGTANLNTSTGSGDNLCNPSSDDNVTIGEMLTLVFDQDVIIDTLWFNNFHDGDQSLVGDNIEIGGALFEFANGDTSNPSFTTSPYFVSAGAAFNIAYADEEFYLHQIDVSKRPQPDIPVPAPASIALLGLGLVGLGLNRKKRGTRRQLA